MRDAIEDLYNVILARKEGGDANSYTAYLFREGLDKILKKCGEECSEVIIAAKSLQAEPATGRTDDLKNELCDLLYHLLVLMAERDIPLADIEAILAERAAKTGNLKQFKTVNKDS
ncbi:MAG: phosphoribosyl-ATP diphosphatase [Clostridiales Family XIII bacterium]|jgi:phosphoribosyl-ATP pyrophosphohydrolase|nr:phosphoribosyl-ATP diphosphatase [Clostridiales Family XIII bacterium]